MVTHTSQILLLGGNSEVVRFQVNYKIDYEGIVPSKIVSDLFYKEEEGCAACIYFWQDIIKNYKLLKKRKKGVKIPAIWNGEKLVFKEKELTLEDVYKSIKWN